MAPMLLLSLSLGTTLPRGSRAAVVHLSPADGDVGFRKIEAAVAGDEVIVAPGTYAFRVYLGDAGTAAAPVRIHSEDPTRPAVWQVALLSLCSSVIGLSVSSSLFLSLCSSLSLCPSRYVKPCAPHSLVPGSRRQAHRRPPWQLHSA